MILIGLHRILKGCVESPSTNVGGSLKYSPATKPLFRIAIRVQLSQLLILFSHQLPALVISLCPFPCQIRPTMTEDNFEPKRLGRTDSGRVIVFDPVNQTLKTAKLSELDGKLPPSE